MSLTSHLKNPSSNITKFIRERFPETSLITKAANKQLSGWTGTNLGFSTWVYGLIGMAIDYRIRYSFAITPSDELVGSLGASYLVSQGIYTKTLIRSLWDSLDETVRKLQPHSRRLTVEDDEILARYCLVLALFEAVYRSGSVDGPLTRPSARKSIKELLEIPESAWVNDVHGLSDLFYEKCSHLLSQSTVLNPTFAGSADVGGADADIIVNGCLIDIKTTVQAKFDPNWIRQIIGYILLDYDDRYKIDSLGIYMSRQGTIFTWHLVDFFLLLSGDDNISLKELRKECKQLWKVERSHNERRYIEQRSGQLVNNS